MLDRRNYNVYLYLLDGFSGRYYYFFSTRCTGSVSFQPSTPRKEIKNGIHCPGTIVETAINIQEEGQENIIYIDTLLESKFMSFR